MTALDPQWVIAGLLIIGQVATAVGVVMALRGEVRRVEEKAEHARIAAQHAHRRVDTLLQGGRNGTSKA